MALGRCAGVALLGARRDVAAARAHVLSGPELAGGRAAPLGRAVGAHEWGQDGAAVGALTEGGAALAAGEASAAARRGIAARRAELGVVPRVGGCGTASCGATACAVVWVRACARGSIAVRLVARRAGHRDSDCDGSRQQNKRAHVFAFGNIEK